MSDNRFNEFSSIVTDMEADFEKFFVKGVNAAGARVRKHLQTLAGLCKDVRKEVTEVKNERKAEKS